MSELRLKKERIWTPQLGSTILFGFLIRLTVLIFMVHILDSVWDIFFIEDDKKFEELAAVYCANAHNLFDKQLFDDLTEGYLQQFWPFVICFFTKLTGYAYIGRVINVIASTFCIYVIYALSYTVINDRQVALRAARLFAYLPLTILISCFPIKDILIMLGIAYAFYIFVSLQTGQHVAFWRILICSLLLLFVYLSRGAVTELMLMFFLVYYLQKLYKEKKYLAAVVLLMLAVVIFLIFRSTIMEAFETKVDTYENYGADEASGLNAIRVTGIRDIYKLPIAYAFATLQPMKLNFFAIGSDIRQWMTVMAYTNIAMYPIAVGSFLYIFSKKHNLFFWLSSFVMYSAVIMLSLGVFRHYLFLLPITIINYSLYISEHYGKRRTLVILGSFALFILVFVYSLMLTI